METSETLTKIIPDLLKAQKEIEKVSKNADNPFFHSKYTDLSVIIDGVKSPLNNNNITVLQPIMKDVVETILIHTSGEFISSETNVICKKEADPQAYGSAISYARRYGLQSLVLLSAEDDDGNSASSNKVTYTPVKTSQSTPQAPKKEYPKNEADDNKPWLDDKTFEALKPNFKGDVKNIMSKLRTKYKVARKWEAEVVKALSESGSDDSLVNEALEVFGDDKPSDPTEAF